MEAQILKTIREQNLIKPGDKLVIGVSGGPDSMALLHLLHSIQTEWKLELHIAHQLGYFDPDKKHLDEKYAQLVKNYCQQLNIDFHLHKTDFSKQKTAKEESARDSRYQFFKLKAKNLKLKAKIALAHNLDENIETMIFNFCRGTGIKGLIGIPYKRNNIIRPLLDTPKKNILEYCKRHNIPHIADYANIMSGSSRNTIRHELIPLISDKLNIDLKKNLSNAIPLLRETGEFIAGETEKLAKSLKLKANNYDLKAWQTLPSFMRREVLRYIAKDYSPNLTDLSQRHLLEIERMLMESQGGSEKTINGVLTIKKTGAKMSVAPWSH